MKSEELDRELASVRVSPGFADSNEARALLDEIGARIVASDRPTAEPAVPRRRFVLPVARRGLVLGWVVAVLAIGGAAAAATAILSTTTVGAGQPGYCQTAKAAADGVPFPTGDRAARNWALLQSSVPKPNAILGQLCAGDAVSAGDSPPSGGTVPVTVGTINEQATFVMVAFCAWTDDWLNAQQRGDTATASRAASEIAKARRWPAAIAVDANSQTLNWLPVAQRAVAAGDVTDVSSMFDSGIHATGVSNSCVLYTPPANSDNGTINVPFAQ